MASGVEALGARSIPDFQGVHAVWPRGDQLVAVRSAAIAYKARFTSQGMIRAVRSHNIAAAFYPVKFAL